jgi:hypothetical protein
MSTIFAKLPLRKNEKVPVSLLVVKKPAHSKVQYFQIITRFDFPPVGSSFMANPAYSELPI